MANKVEPEFMDACHSLLVATDANHCPGKGSRPKMDTQLYTHGVAAIVVVRRQRGKAGNRIRIGLADEELLVQMWGYANYLFFSKGPGCAM